MTQREAGGDGPRDVQNPEYVAHIMLEIAAEAMEKVTARLRCSLVNRIGCVAYWIISLYNLSG